MGVVAGLSLATCKEAPQNTTTLLCDSPCADESDCPRSHDCEKGYCHRRSFDGCEEDGLDWAGICSRLCKSDDDCCAGMVCDDDGDGNDICVEEPPPQPCREKGSGCSNGSCCGGLLCETDDYDRFCVCDALDECESDEECDGEHCVLGCNNGSWDDDTYDVDLNECVSDVCIFGTCGGLECDIDDPSCPVGKKCSWSDGRHLCVPESGTGQHGDVCTAQGDPPGSTGEDDCDTGAICVDVVPETKLGQCASFCGGSSDATICPDQTLCADTAAPLLCRPTCDPLEGGIDCPEPSDLCAVAHGAEGFACTKPHPETPSGAYGQPCAAGDRCASGLWCDKGGDHTPMCGGWCCSEYCDLNGPNTCADQAMGRECLPLWQLLGWSAAPPGLEDVGGCGFP